MADVLSYREFVLEMCRTLPRVYPHAEGVGMISPKGKPELKTRDEAQINAWIDAEVPLVINGVTFKNKGRRVNEKPEKDDKGAK
jgi:hypothetical protein